MEKYEKIVLHIPHASMEGIVESGWPLGKEFFAKVRKWTDWNTDYLFKTYLDRVSPVRFNLSRFIVDAERLENDPLESIGEGIVYQNFEGFIRNLTDVQIKELLSIYYKHLENIRKELTERSLLIDCHSFPSELSPIDICIGFNTDWSKPSDDVINVIVKNFQDAGYKVGINHPYSNSISPKCSFSYHSIMIEINKRTYMNENTLELEDRAEELRNTILKIYNELLDDKA